MCFLLSGRTSVIFHSSQTLSSPTSAIIDFNKPYKKRKFGICLEKYGKCPEIFRASGKHSETVMFWNIFWTLDSGQILDKFWSVKKMSGICASGKCSKT
ncbi:hypothetical protein RIR_jg16642.t1 [Rhizophagus irregularis DAOM 181602=DAOM 197198]|nr:hypothetical protein RIR_jg16642.t1 [Rhizophagus irregularis DAOM 181602=DAOM 197198]